MIRGKNEINESMPSSKKEDEELFSKIKMLLGPKNLPSDLLEGSALNLPDLKGINAPPFHQGIVNKILNTNKKLMKSSSLWAFLYFGYNHSEYCSFRMQNQKLNLAINAIYHWAAPRSPSPEILAAIDDLLLGHIKKMRDSDLFEINFNDICAYQSTWIQDNRLLNADSGECMPMTEVPTFKTTTEIKLNVQDGSKLAVYSAESLFTRGWREFSQWISSYLAATPKSQGAVLDSQIQMSSVALIKKSLPTPADSFLVNSFISNRLGILGIEKNLKGCYLTYAALNSAYRAMQLTPLTTICSG